MLRGAAGESRNDLPVSQDPFTESGGEGGAHRRAVVEAEGKG